MLSDWIESTLLAYAPLASLVGVKVYEELAPADIDYPFVVFNAQSPPRVVRGVGLATVMVSAVYTIKAVGRGDSYTALAPVANAIHDGIIQNDTDVVAGGFVFTCSYEQQVMYVEPKGAVQFRNLGGEYAVQAQAS